MIDKQFFESVCIQNALVTTWENCGYEDFSLFDFVNHSEFILEFARQIYDEIENDSLPPKQYQKKMLEIEKEKKKQDAEFNSMFGSNENGKKKSNKKQTKKR
jgi:hypothetical protein